MVLTAGLVEAVMIRPSQEACRYFSKKRSNGHDYQPRPDDGTKKEKELTLQRAVKGEKLDNLVATLIVHMEKILSSDDDSSIQLCTEHEDTRRNDFRCHGNSDNALNSDDPDDSIHDDPQKYGISHYLHQFERINLIEDLFKSESIPSQDDIVENFGSEHKFHQESSPVNLDSQFHFSNDLEEDDVESFWRCFPAARSQGIVGRKSCLKGTKRSIVAGTDGAEQNDETAGMKIKSFLKRTQRTVQFGEVHVRQYGVDLGDNPSCGSGPAISLSWEFSATKHESLELYEVTRTSRRHRDELRLTDREREAMLLESGFTLHEQSVAMESSARDKIRRMKTVLNGKYSRYEEKLECARDMMMRLLHLRKNDEEMMEALWEDAYLDEHDEVRTAALRHFRNQQRTFHSRCA